VVIAGRAYRRGYASVLPAWAHVRSVVLASRQDRASPGPISGAQAAVLPIALRNASATAANSFSSRSIVGMLQLWRWSRMSPVLNL
jgi:hypothetical protein